MLDLLFLPLNPLALTLLRWPGCLTCRFPIPATAAPVAALLALLSPPLQKPLTPLLLKLLTPPVLVLAHLLVPLIPLVRLRLVLVLWSPVWRGRGR